MNSIKRTRDWIYKWLLVWLLPFNKESIITFQVGNHVYDFCFHFRIGFTIYGIYEDKMTNEVIWFSFENDYFSDEQFLAAPRFRSYRELMIYAVEEFYKKWNTDMDP